MREFIRSVACALELGQSVELVSVIESGGSTPRGAGAMLAVFPDGTTCGTVGGGNVEYEAVKLAAELLAQGKNAIRQFRFVQGDAASLGMVCGGDVRLHFHYLAADDEKIVAELQKLLTAAETGAAAWLVRHFADARVTEMRMYLAADAVHASLPSLMKTRPVLSPDGWFSIPVVRPGKVYIFGGGHVSQALVPAVAAVGFRPVVYDDRPEFAAPALFPLAETVICGSFEALTQHVALTPEDYVVIMTRGHQADYEVLTQTLRSGVKYLGCIGSRKKLALCQERLLKAGFTAEEYARVHAPIGLAIGAETPAEIAVSVTAELIAVRAGLA